MSPATLAGMHAAIGGNDEAFRLLDEAWADRNSWLVDVRVGACFAPLRSDPRSAASVRRMHFAMTATGAGVRLAGEPDKGPS